MAQNGAGNIDYGRSRISIGDVGAAEVEVFASVGGSGTDAEFDAGTGPIAKLDLAVGFLASDRIADEHRRVLRGEILLCTCQRPVAA